MENNEILEGNKLIALFMGFKSEPFENKGGKGFSVTLNGQPKKWGGNYSVSYYGSLEHNINICVSMYGGFKYHSSWDWLMPVVEKIATLETEVHICNWKTEIFSEHFPYKDVHFTEVDKTHKTKMIELCYKAVLEFIKFYNQQN